MEVVDLAGANVAATLANIHRAPDSRPYNLLDFALLAEKPDPDQDDMEASRGCLDAVCDEVNHG